MADPHMLAPPDIFIVVRPPPSPTNHPFNLQIQLLGHPSRARNTRTASVTSTVSATDNYPSPVSSSTTSLGLDSPNDNSLSSRSSRPPSRTSSVVSDRSMYSLGVGTPSSPTSSARRTVPMYNLVFHSLLPTVVTDAGTDAKVAKFLKKGTSIDLFHFGILEAREKGPLSKSASSLFLKSQPEERLKRSPSARNSLSLAPTSSRDSRLSTTYAKSTSSKSTPAINTSSSTNHTSSSGFLGKIKRWSILRGSAPEEQPPPSLAIPPVSPTKSLVPSADSDDSDASRGAPKRSSRRAQSAQRNPDGYGVPMFRTNSRGEIAMSTRHAPGYTWRVRKWSRQELDPCELSIEWTKTKPKRRRGRKQITSTRPRSQSIGVKSLDGQSSPTATYHSRENKNEDPNQLVRRRRQSIRSSNELNPESVEAADQDVVIKVNGSNCSSQNEDIDDPESSDPEDSDSSWKCELVIGNNEKRMEIAHLTPAPHHPRIVGRLVSLGELGNTMIDASRGIFITAEECKDAMAVTALWLVVRESLGGVGKRRKGEGQWRLKT